MSYKLGPRLINVMEETEYSDISSCLFRYVKAKITSGSELVLLHKNIYWIGLQHVGFI